MARGTTWKLLSKVRNNRRIWNEAGLGEYDHLYTVAAFRARKVEMYCGCEQVGVGTLAILKSSAVYGSRLQLDSREAYYN
ncbi:hypothetical protein L195_g054347 [Trifolium pratense]|uniref:Uncharacterized protein n=1 Tax=Trifolium pratense TaxID=57577 RepID=A0A2K3KFN6_TRIPR|nr:hypothetical protein L195_g054347 [Trifolium pratense]